MARPKKTIRTIFKTIGLPEDLVARLELDLFSELEGRVPLGAQQEFFTKLIREHYVKLDTARMFASMLPEPVIIRITTSTEEPHHGE